MLSKDGKMHFSALKNFAKSPAHYLSYINGEFSDSPQMRIGRAAHKLVLQNIDPYLYCDRRAGKEWELFCANFGDISDVLNLAEYDAVNQIAESVRKNVHAMEIIKSATSIEEKIEWVLDGIPFAGTPDGYSSGLLFDLKTCASAYPRKFLWDAKDRNYHAQLALYDIALGTEYIPGATMWREQYLIAVENTAPYNCVVYKIDDLRIEQGYQQVMEWIATYKECVKSGNWGGYSVEQPYIWDGDIYIGEPEE